MCGFTSDFDRAAAGFSPDRVDGLVWGLSELLVEPMGSFGIFELYREQAAALATKKAAEAKAKAEANKPSPAPGSLEWMKLMNTPRK